MSADLEEFFARARDVADSIAFPIAAEARRRGDRRRRRQTVVVVVSVFAIVAASLGGIAWATRSRAHPNPAGTPSPGVNPPTGFKSLRFTGTPIAFGEPGRKSVGLTLASGGRGFAAWHTQNPDQLVLASIDLRTGRKEWGPVPIDVAGDWLGLSLVPDQNVLVALAGNQGVTYFFDAATGHERWHTTGASFVADGVVVAAGDDDRLAGRDLFDGHALWHSPVQDVAPLSRAAVPSAFGMPISTSDHVASLNSSGQLDIFDVHKGPDTRRRTTVVPGSYIAGGTGEEILIGSPVGPPLELTAVATDGRSRSIYKGHMPVDSMVFATPCFDGSICLTEGHDLVAVDGTGAVRRTDLGLTPYGIVTTIGPDTVLVGGRLDDDAVYRVLDRTGRTLSSYAPKQDDQHVDVVRDGVILGPSNATERSRALSIAAITRDGTTGRLGQILATGLCSADDDALLCLGDNGVSSWSFR